MAAGEAAGEVCGMRRFLGRTVTRAITSHAVRDLARGASAMRRILSGAPPRILYFHDPSDPYSHLTAQLLAPLSRAYQAVFEPLLVSPPAPAAAPEPGRLASFSLRDARRLAAAHGLDPPGETPASAAAIAAAVRALSPLSDPAAFGEAAQRLGETLRRGAEEPSTLSPLEVRRLAMGDALRARFGHYLGAVFYFEGEWYWGVDRLPYLEERLAFARRPGALMVTRFLDESAASSAQKTPPGTSLDFFLSFRSPYTYLAAERVSALARRYGAQLRLRFVLPMVMRGLPVPRPKQLYIVRDAKREAVRRGLPFGDMVDPVGAGAERGLAVLHHAIKAGKGEAFAQAFLKGVFAQGLDSASDAGLGRIAANAGIPPEIVKSGLSDPSWRAVAEANREELFALGLWGVPSFRVSASAAHWGQDRLWAVEQDLAALSRRETAIEPAGDAA